MSEVEIRTRLLLSIQRALAWMVSLASKMRLL